jgi:hypothetical protein
MNLFRFVAGELALVFASSDTVLERSGIEQRPLPSIGVAGSAFAAPIGGDVDTVARFVRVRRITAMFYSLFCVVLPSLPLVVGVMRCEFEGGDWLIGAIVAGVVVFVPASFVGLVVAAKLSPGLFALLGVKQS